MLIEFSVSNFRSFRERQTFSMVASPRMRRRENIFAAPVKGEKLPPLLKIAVIYGPNASGKSNLLNALSVIDRLAGRTPNSDAVKLPVWPFRFDPMLATQPSKFEIHFLASGCRYEFSLEATPDRITRERLIAYPLGKEALLYDRQYVNGAETYEFGELEGDSVLHEAWKKLTPPRLLFISQAVANSSEELTQLRAPLAWLQHGMWKLSGDMEELAGQALRSIRKLPAVSKGISSFLRDIDVPVTSVSLREDAASAPAENGDPFSILAEGRAALQSAVFTHTTSIGSAEIDFADESDGTKNLIGFWLPWTVRNASEQTFNVLVVDELDSSLHPLIVGTLLKRHLESPDASQLIFTTHDTHLMDSKILRRDQFWLAERDAAGATQLRSIHDFDGREGEDIEKRYFEGRYRALPQVRV